MIRSASTWSVAVERHVGYISHVERATVSKLKDKLSAYLRKVRAGYPVVIYDRDVPIARLERIEASGRGAERLALLHAQGVARPPRRPMTAARARSLMSNPVVQQARLLEALESERDDSR